METAHGETKTLFLTAGSLFALLALTVGLSFVQLGSYNFPLAIAIAVGKAILVAAFFMELRHGSRILWLLAGGAALWLLLLRGGILADLVTRVSIVLPMR